MVSELNSSTIEPLGRSEDGVRLSLHLDLASGSVSDRLVLQDRCI